MPTSNVFFNIACVASLLLVVMRLNDAAAQVALPPRASQPASLRTASSPALEQIINGAARQVLDARREAGMKESDLAITLVDLSSPEPFAAANFNGEAAIYPASVVKLFYLAAAHRQMEDGELKDTPELRRALRDMIVDSSNDATHYVVDALTGTSSGIELPEAEMKEWAYRRNRMNRYFSALGYRNINVNQKTYCEDAYGRERAFRGAQGENRNRLTTNATARLLAEIVLERTITPARSREMMTLLKRDPYAATGSDPDDQSRGFTGRAINGAIGARIADVRLWSKAGWTSTTRHDAAYIELPGGKRFVLVTFTTNQAREPDIIPTIARQVINYFHAAGQTAR